MESITKEQMKQAGYFQLFGDAYRLLEKYVGEKEIDWEMLVDEADEICRKRPGPLGEKMIIAIVAEVEDVYRASKNGRAGRAVG